MPWVWLRVCCRVPEPGKLQPRHYLTVHRPRYPRPPPQDLADSELRRAHEVSELHRTKAERLAKVVEQKEEHIVYLTNEHKEEVAWLEAKIKKAKEEQEKENASRLEHMRGHLMEMYVVLGCARGRLACVGC